MLRRSVFLLGNAGVRSARLRRALELRRSVLANGPATTMCCLAVGTQDGLQHPLDRLERYDTTVRLVRATVNSTDGPTVDPVEYQSYVSEVSACLQEQHPTAAATSDVLDCAPQAHAQVLGEWRDCFQDESADRIADGLQAKRSQSGKGKAAAALLIENGIMYPTVLSAGLRCLRALRLRFAVVLTNALHAAIAQATEGSERAADIDLPLRVLDASSVDTTLSRVAVQLAEENGMDEAVLQITSVPLSSEVAESPSFKRMPGVLKESAPFSPGSNCIGADSIAKRIAIVDWKPNALPEDALRGLPPLHFDVSALTTSIEVHAVAPRTEEEGESEGNKSLAALASGVIAATKRDGTVFITLVPRGFLSNSSSTDGDGDVDVHPRETEVGRRLIAAAHGCIAEGLAQNRRWGDIEEEVWSAADCPRSAYTIRISLD